MKLSKKNLGQFYTKNANYIIGNLINDIPCDAYIVDPFCGEWDLLNAFDNKNKTGYDIDPKNEKTIKIDTLLKPPNYDKKWVITNPPYLARNKNSNKEIYDKYKLDDYYKIALKTVMDCDGGILILPLNFFSGDDFKIRKEF